jgi:hypothetical protein
VRTTNLPAHVQHVYLQAAMKLFLRACCDISSADLSKVIAVVRRNLNVFLQSLHVEVQERATTLRRLLDEFDILPMGWEEVERNAKRKFEEEAALRIANRNMSAQAEGNLMDLEFLDFSAVATSVSAASKDIDNSGADAAIRKKAVLGALLVEPLYAVHAKAQKRVPKPENIDLTSTLNPEALRKIFEMELPKNISMGNVCFCEPLPAAAPDHFKQQSSSSAQSQFKSPVSLSASGKMGTVPGGSSNSSTPYASPANNSYADATVFNLGHASSQQAQVQAQLGDILANSFEETTKKKKDKSLPKTRRKKDLLFKNTLPSGVSDSDEEDLLTGRTKAARPTRTYDPLANIDLTSKVGEDEERLPEFKHRETQAYERPPAPTQQQQQMDMEVPTFNDKAAKKEKKDKKDKKEPKKEKNGDADLLGMEFMGLTPTPVTMPVQVAHVSESTVDKKEKKEKKEKKQKKDKY